VSRPTSIRTRAREVADEVQRKLIIEATCDVIATEGLEATSLRRIAESLDCTTGLITHYFSSKDELLVKALEHVLGLLTGGAQSDPNTVVSLSDRLDHFMKTLPIDGDARRFWLVLLAFRAASVGNPRLAAVYDRIGEESLATLCVSVAAELGRTVDDPEVKSIAAAINAVLEGFGDGTAISPDVYTPELVRRRTSTIVAALIDEARK
jgi:AcrR family transcriptional regulator